MLVEYAKSEDMQNRVCAPLLLFVYNRPDHTLQTIDALKKNELSEETDLVIFSDAPSKSNHENDVLKVRELIHGVSGFKSVEIIERRTNMGLAASIIDGVTKVCNERGRVIVLEDDLVTSPYFLRYMNDALNLYSDDERVISVCAYAFPLNCSMPENYFLCDPGCWGWATWKRGWDLFEQDGLKLLSALQNKKLEYRFNFSNSYDYIGMLKSQISGINDSWAVRWYASAFLNEKLTIYPGKTLVSNIGTDGSGRHRDSSNLFVAVLSSAAIQLGEANVEENLIVREALIKYLRSIRAAWPRRTLNYFRNQLLTILK